MSSAAASPLPPSAAQPLPALEEERRLVTALFCDLVGFTPLSERLDPEEVREIQAAYFGALSRQIERYGGIVEKYAGDAVLALFGVPTAHEDDPERAVLCALGMQAAMGPVATSVQQQYGVTIAVRIGVNTGEVVSGTWDASGTQQAAVTGDAVNTAARLQAAAEAGGILVGSETVRLTRRRIRYADPRLLDLKGKQQPVPVSAVLGIRKEGEDGALGDAGGGVLTPLVGRGQELDRILGLWSRVQQGEGQLLTVLGEPGVGKSRLVAEGLTRILTTDAPRIARGRCLSYGQSVSLWLIAELIRSLCSIPEDAGLDLVKERIAVTIDDVLSDCDETDRAIARDVLGEVLGLPPGDSLVAHAGPQIRRQSLVRALRLVLTGLTSRGPVALVLEDLHWSDSASNDIMAELLVEVHEVRILVLAVQRPGWTAPWSEWRVSQRLDLDPLPDAEAIVLAEAVLGGVLLSEELAHHIRDRVGGNPFFVEESLRYLKDSGGVTDRDGEITLLPRAADRVPSTLTEVLMARLDRLEQEVKHVAQVGSVIGRSFAIRILSRVMDREETRLDAPLHALEHAEIAYPRRAPDLEYVFKHVLLRDVAYGMLVQRRKRQLHLQTARAIESLYPAEEYTELIAYHYARTQEHGDAAVWLERAGDRAADAFANETAGQHYREALSRLETVGADGVSLARVQGKLGRTLERVGRYEEALPVLEEAIGGYREIGDVVGQVGTTADLGFVLEHRGAVQEAQQRLIQMVSIMEAHLQSSHAVALARAGAELYVTLSEIYQFQGQYEEMLDAADRAGELARMIEDERLRGMSEQRRGSAFILLGRIEEGRDALETAISVHEKTGNLRWLLTSVGNLGENRRQAGDLERARQLSERSLELAMRAGRALIEMFSHLNLCQIQVAAGEWKDARHHLERAEQIAAAQETAVHLAPFFPLERGELELREGDWDVARQQLRRSVDLAQGNNQEMLEIGCSLLAELDIREGRPQEARDRLVGLVPAEGANLPLLLPALSWAHLESGDLERGLEVALRGEGETRERQALLYLPEALRIKGMALARLDRVGDARSALDEGRVRAAAMPNPYTEARILVEIGMLDRQEGHEERAGKYLEEALTIFRRLGAASDADLVERIRSAPLTSQNRTV